VTTDSSQHQIPGPHEGGEGEAELAEPGEAGDESRTEELDQEPNFGEKADRSVDFLEGLLERMDLDAQVVEVSEDERINIEIEGADAGRVIGKKGQTLDALQFLVNKVVNRFPEGRKHVVLDVEGYKDRRDESLANMAVRLADKASRTGKVISINPMPARERRVIHLALADTPGVTTRSDGEGTERRVRIVPANRRRDRSRR
jgi:spoIIIJ-associated protein